MVDLETSKHQPRLFLSRIDEEFDPNHDLVLGPWCFIGNEEKSPDWAQLSFFDAFDAGDELQEATIMVEWLLSNRIAAIRDELNKRHSVDYSLPFWWTLTQRWMINLISASWRRWVHLEKFIKRHGHERLAVIVSNASPTNNFEFKSSADFSKRGLQSEHFDLWLWSQCLEPLAPGTWTLQPRCNTIDFEEPPVADPPVQSNILRRFLRSRLGRLPFSDVPGASALAIGFFSLFLQTLTRRKSAEFKHLQRQTPSKTFPPEYLSLLERLIERTMPRSFNEDFRERDKLMTSMSFKPGRLFVNGSATINDDANLQVAHAIEAGERIVHMQHGSDYGTMAHISIEASGEFLNDAFLTWGWTSQNGYPGNFIPVPAPGLSRMRNGHCQKTDDVILVGTKMTLCSRRIDCTPQPTKILKYRQEKLTFFDGLSSKARRDFMYRDYMRTKNDIEDATFMQANIDGLKLCRGNFENAILGCKVLVLDHPGTLLNVAMAANIPTVCYWDRDTWRLAPEAIPYFDALYDAKVIFSNASDAAHHINDIVDDCQGWWRSSDVQEARVSWAYQYARTSKLWWWYWMKALVRL